VHGQGNNKVSSVQTLCQLLDARAVGGRGKYVFLRDGREPIASLTFAQLARRARSLASVLRERSQPGERAILLYPPGAAFLPAFFGCLYAGVVAVPVPPLDAARLKRSLPRLLAIMADAEPQLLLTTGELPLETAERLSRSNRKLHVVDTELATAGDAQEPMECGVRSAPCADLAYLQYTSGSTSRPRGVMVRHRNLLHNLEYLRRAFLYDSDSVVVTWMPSFHDYGLVEGLMQPLYSDIPVHVLSPLTVLKRPVRWLEAISRNRATHSHGPNFAYELCIQRATAEGLDLSSWRMAGTGAETVRADTLERFARAFAPAGFSADAFFPAYGLAEATLFVTARRPDARYKVLSVDAPALERHHVVPLAQGPNRRTVVSCGVVQGESCLRIVDPATSEPCASDRVGEIWLSDPSVALGYRGSPADSAATFAAHVGNDQMCRRFLRTGDLGFLHEGELYVTGRIKDLIIIAGANHYPADIEWTIERNCPEVRRNHCAAFTVDDEDGEQLVIVAEVERQQTDWSDLFRRVRAAVANEHELAPCAIAIVARGAILKTSSGKLQRSACKKAFLEGELPTMATWRRRSRRPSVIPVNGVDAGDLRRWLCGELGAMLGIDAGEIDPDVPFADYGLNSISSVALVAALEDWLGRGELSPTLPWEHPSLTALCAHLAGAQAPSARAVASSRATTAEPIAIIGLGCRFPGAPTVDAYWELLRGGRSTIGSNERMPGTVAGFLDAPEAFDAAFFQLSASEAAAMDPRQRLLLEVAWEALEHAALAPESLRGRPVGVFIGASSEDFAFRLFQQPNAIELVSAHTGTGFASSVTANRLSYTLDLRGPSLTIDTACSSSLVAVHQACQSLRSNECELALAGGVNLLLSEEVQHALACAGMLSPSGRCQTFDAEADGYVRGEGCGLVVLKRLSDAQRAGSHVLAVIRASAVNQDGRSNGLTAPNPQAQAALIRAALTEADVAPATIDYVEAHGTGTRLGDPIEVGVLQAILAEGRASDERCWIGSVKTNIGHLEAAAGIAGLIKAVLALEHGEIPPHLNLRQLNPLIRIGDAPLAIPTILQPWPRLCSPRPRRAGVSSFGFGGTNAHVVLEYSDYALPAPPPSRRESHVFTISASTDTALRELAARYAARLEKKAADELDDLCFTVATGRAHLQQRFAMVVADTEMLADHLQRFAAGSEAGYAGRAPAQRPDIAFLFSGQGAQHAGMARQLYAGEPLFRSVLDECAALTRGHLPEPLLPVIFGEIPGLLDHTAYTQPALFAVEYGLARLWQHWGIEPTAVLGHSIGEYVAACVANVLGLREALDLVVARGLLMDRLPRAGRMLAVAADEADLAAEIERCAGKVEVAAVNAPRSIVLSGDGAAVLELQERVAAAGLPNHLLPVSHAFHSPLMEPILDEFAELASRFSYAKPTLRFISNLDGRPLTAAPDAAYWTRHLRNTVQFASGVAWLGRTHRIFVEVGPQPALSALAARCLPEADVLCLPSLRRGYDDRAVLMDSLARLHVAGATPVWRRIHENVPRRRLHGLPTYPFERKCFPLPGATGRPIEPTAPARRQFPSIEQWAQVPALTPVSPPVGGAPGEWLILADQGAVGSRLAAALESSGAICTPCRYRPERPPAGEGPLKVVCLWALDWPMFEDVPSREIWQQLEPLLDRMVQGLQTLMRLQSRPPQLILVTRCACEWPGATTATQTGLPQSVLWGLGRSLRQEYPDWRIRLVDLSGGDDELVRDLTVECRGEDACTEVCWRDGTRHAIVLVPRELQASEQPWRTSGTWLVTGGFGKLGLAAAMWLADRGARQLVLVGRRPPNEEATARIAALRARKVAVAERLLDVADSAAVRVLADELRSSPLPIEGVIHAAGVIQDGVFYRLDSDKLKVVLAPKVLGAWHLHVLTRDLPLRHFVLFSSASNLFGNSGQSAYAAANAFLDSLAHLRRRSGLPGLSINWGAWAGQAARQRLARRLEHAGVLPIPHDEGLEAFGRALALDVAQLAIIPSLDGAPLKLASSVSNKAPGKSAIQTATADLVPRLQAVAADVRVRVLTRHVQEVAAAILGCPPDEIEAERGFFEQGLDSLNVVELRNRLQGDLGRAISTTLPFDFPTPSALAAWLLRQLGLTPSEPVAAPAIRPAEPNPSGADAIAIIGMGCRMPGGVHGPDDFWMLLRDGVDAISQVPPDRWDADAYYHPDPDHAGTILTRYGGFLEFIDGFDAEFFGIAPREALQIDPQQRILLEVCFETLEHAGIPPSSLLGTQTGVFIGISTNDYLQRLCREPVSIDGYLATGNALSLAANRLSYLFGLEGPSLAVDTACSSSLVALHQAVQSLRAGELDLAIAGGVNLLLDPTISINHTRARMLSADGRCKAFSAAADGYVRSEGCGVVLLKPLAAARRDDDRILAVIRGSAVNQDGRTSGLTVPNGQAQQRVIRRALQQAKLPAATISYVEAHGTGTPLGDPIEAEALAAVFGGARTTLEVGSVKTNIGHIEAAAGIAGLLKVVLAMQNRMLPAHLHCSTLNPRIDWDASPIRITATTRPWPSDGEPRRAGVSSFGFGGTNAHVILEEAPDLPPRAALEPSLFVLPLSAKTRDALRELACRYCDHLAVTSDHPADICFTAACGRDQYRHRLAICAPTLSALRNALQAWLRGESTSSVLDGLAVIDRGEIVGDGALRAAGAAPDDWRRLAAAYVTGASVDWRACYAGHVLRRVSLPGHPFHRQRYFVDPPPSPRAPVPYSYRLDWCPAPHPPPAGSDNGGAWLVLADDSGWGEAIAAILESNGRRCRILHQPKANGSGGASSGDDEHAFRALLAEAGPLQGIAYLWPLNCPPPIKLEAKRLPEIQRRQLAPLLGLARSLVEVPHPPRLWLLTRAAQAAVRTDEMSGLMQTPVWGIGRTMALELPAIFAGIIDLPAGSPQSADVAMAMAPLVGARVDTQYAVREGSLYRPRLRACALSQGHAPLVRSDASYLVAGGFGSLGRAFAHWLVSEGAREIWLLGRRGARDPAAATDLIALQRAATVRTAAVDLADASALDRQLSDWGVDGLPLRGVFHAAGLNGRSALGELDWPLTADLLTAKVQGTWAISHALGERELDFFIACSSVAALWGGQQQAAYSAANAFLDGFAHYRKAHRKPALSIALGPIADSTMLDDDAAAALARIGLRAIPFARLTAELPRLVAEGAPHLAFVDADFEQFASLYAARSPTDLFADLRKETTKGFVFPPVSPADPQEALSSEGLKSWLATQVAAALRLPHHQIDGDAPLPRLGLDSLMAVELRNRIQRRLGVIVPLPDLLGDLGVNALAQRVTGACAGGTQLSTGAVAENWIGGEI